MRRERSGTRKLMRPTWYFDNETAIGAARLHGQMGFGVALTRSKERDKVLRISMVGEAGSFIRLKVEGMLAAEGVGVLERECTGFLDAGKHVELDLCDVSFVDSPGIESLREISARGVRLTHLTPLVQALFEGGDTA
jgi:hypothetical protein